MSEPLFSVRMRASARKKHISGAEGIYKTDRVEATLLQFLYRALNHERGLPEEVVLTVEPIKDKPLRLKAPPVYTARIRDNHNAWSFIKELLMAVGISPECFERAKELIFSACSLRGAAVYTTKTTMRLDRNHERGIRARMLGITEEAKVELYEILEAQGLDTRVVSEALVLATKVINTPGVVAELCVSDNPSYTTGYVSIRGLGYIRVPFIKHSGSDCGGRVFFVEEDADITAIEDFLRNRPVMVNEISTFHGIINPDEIIGLLDSKSCIG